jgi:hypothetical protein
MYEEMLAIKEMQIKTNWASVSTHSEWLLSRKQTATNADNDVGGKEHLYTVGKDIN